MNEHIIEISNLRKRFPGIEAISEVSLNIGKGKVWGLLGPNGSGKSTLLKCIIGLYKPDRGKVLVFGETPSRKTKEKIAYLPEVDHLYRWMRIGEVLSFIGAFYEDWDEVKARELTQFMNIDIDQKVGTLSRGMRARLRLVITMARNAKLILLDEPLAGIDPASRGRIIEALISSYREDEQTIILSTHEVGETESIFDSVIFLESGKIKIIDSADVLRMEKDMSINDIFKEVYM